MNDFSVADIPAKKSLGQNFLKNQGILKKISEKTEEILKKEQKNHKEPIHILEIGPGKGALTSYLLSLGNPVTAIEADDRLIPFLQETFPKELKNKGFSLIHTDIREFEPKNLKNPYILVANIPYYLTGYIFRQFLESDNQPIAMVVMIQKEVAKRIIDKKQTLLSLGVQTYGQPYILCNVSKGSFVPAPKVDSSILVVENISKNLFPNNEIEKKYWEIAKIAFGSKRKQIGGTVLRNFPKNTELDRFSKERPENLKPADWIELLSSLH